MPQDANSQPNFTQNLLSLLMQGGTSPAAAPTQTPAQPAATSAMSMPPAGASPATTQAAPVSPAMPQSQGMNPVIQGLMGQSQQAMNSPMGQPVPQGGGLIDTLKHPLVAGIIKALATAAQSYGWTAMQPSERIERTQMQQQKAESLARLAETGAYQEGMLGIRGQQAGTQQQRADTQATDVASKTDYRKFQEQNMDDRLQLAQDQSDWKKEMASGRLDKAQQLIDQKATQFEQKIALAQKQFGLDQTKVELSGEGLGIKQGMLDLARTALSQKGTVEGAQAMTKIQQFKIEHPIMSQFMDMSDLDSLVGGSQGAGLPGVAPAQSPVVPQSSTTAPQTKGQAKSGKAGGTHIYFDAQGNMVTK